MNEIIIKAYCASFMNIKKGYTVEIDDFKDTTNNISFEVRVLKNGCFRAKEFISLHKESGLSTKIQLNSKMEKFHAAIINNHV